MLNNLSQQSSQSSENLVVKTLPDPWDDTKNISEPKTEAWEAPVDIHPLICGEEKPEASKINPMQVLIEDGLKIKVYDSSQLKEHLKEALALLSWMVNVPSECIS